jgi:hypothetical protein
MSDDLDAALREIARGDVVYGPALSRPVQTTANEATAVSCYLSPLVGLLPPGKGVIAHYEKGDDMRIESIIRCSSSRQRDLTGMDPTRDRVEAAGREAERLIGPAQALLHKAQQGRLTLEEYRGARAKLGKQASILEGLVALWQLSPQQLNLGDHAVPIGGFELEDPWLRGRPEEVVARVQTSTRNNQFKLMVAVDEVRHGRREGSAKRMFGPQMQNGTRKGSARHWKKMTGLALNPLDVLLLSTSQRLGSLVVACLTETQRLGDMRVLHRIEQVKVTEKTLRSVLADLNGRSDASRLAELDLT